MAALLVHRSELRASPGVDKPRESRLVLEVDLRTEFNKRFVEEKVLPGLAYINSPAYRERFGANTGRWLCVTTGAERLQNMKNAAEKVGKAAQAFYYTTFAKALEPGAFFVKSIWSRPTHEQEVALFRGSAEQAPETP